NISVTKAGDCAVQGRHPPSHSPSPSEEGTTMVAVSTLSWEEIASPAFDSPARTAWRQAVEEVASNARATLSESQGRIDSAVKIVLAGDVEVLEGGTARVASQSHGTTQYLVCNGSCTCADYPRAPQSLCKHRLAAAIHRRATARARLLLRQLD